MWLSKDGFDTQQINGNEILKWPVSTPYNGSFAPTRDSSRTQFDYHGGVWQKPVPAYFPTYPEVPSGNQRRNRTNTYPPQQVFGIEQHGIEIDPNASMSFQAKQRVGHLERTLHNSMSFQRYGNFQQQQHYLDENRYNFADLSNPRTFQQEVDNNMQTQVRQNVPDNRGKLESHYTAYDQELIYYGPGKKQGTSTDYRRDSQFGYPSQASSQILPMEELANRSNEAKVSFTRQRRETFGGYTPKSFSGPQLEQLPTKEPGYGIMPLSRRKTNIGSSPRGSEDHSCISAENGSDMKLSSDADRKNSTPTNRPDGVYYGVVLKCNLHSTILIDPLEDLSKAGWSPTEEEKHLRGHCRDIITNHRPAYVVEGTRVEFNLVKTQDGVYAASISGPGRKPILNMQPPRIKSSEMQRERIPGTGRYFGTVAEFDWTTGNGTIKQESIHPSLGVGDFVYFCRNCLRSADKVWGVETGAKVGFNLYKEDDKFGAFNIRVAYTGSKLKDQRPTPQSLEEPMSKIVYTMI